MAMANIGVSLCTQAVFLYRCTNAESKELASKLESSSYSGVKISANLGH